MRSLPLAGQPASTLSLTGQKHLSDKLLSALVPITTSEPARNDDLQAREARAREAGPFRDSVEDISGIQVYRKHSASTFCGR